MSIISLCCSLGDLIGKTKYYSTRLGEHYKYSSDGNCYVLYLRVYLTLEGLGEFKTVMQTQNEVEGLHYCQEFSNPSRVYIRLCKHRKKVVYCFYKIPSSKKYNAEKDKKIHFTDQNVSSHNIDLTMGFLNGPIKTYMLKMW